jgi:subfamily B ATP-binding cassette protein MsbA
MSDFIRQIWNLNRPYRGRLALGVVFTVLNGFAEPLLLLSLVFVFRVIFPGVQDDVIGTQVARSPALIKGLMAHLEQWLPPAEAGSRTVFTALVVVVVPLVMLLRGALSYLSSYLLNWVAVRAISDLRTRLFGHLLNLPLRFLTANSTGELMSRVGDVAALHNLVCNALLVVLKDPITLVSYLTVLFVLQPKLTLATMVAMPLCLFPLVIYSRKVRRSSLQIQAEFAKLSQLMHESFSGARVVKAYNLEGRVLDEFKAATRRFIAHYMRVNRSAEIPGPLIEFCGAIGVSAVLLYMATVGGGKTAPADFLGFVLAIFGMYRPLKSLSRLHSQVVQARAASERVFQLLATRSDVPEPAQPKPLRAAGADIRFESIGFSYGEKPVLSGVNVTVKAGQLVALVGASGSGKTTMTSLLLRFYDPQQGVIRIGDTDIRDVSLRDLRSQIAVVTQETILFNDTIARNIELGRPGASRAEIEAAARHAHASEFIREKPQGFDTVVGEKGILLSGGQRQRIAIARAILKNAPILVLDEATSSLDTESERAVQAALDELMVGRTTLCIAHRLSTIQHADVIVVMAQGHIVETGTHEQLLARGGHYRRLYELQFKD